MFRKFSLTCMEIENYMMCLVAGHISKVLKSCWSVTLHNVYHGRLHQKFYYYQIFKKLCHGLSVCERNGIVQNWFYLQLLHLNFFEKISSNRENSLEKN